MHNDREACTQRNSGAQHQCHAAFHWPLQAHTADSQWATCGVFTTCLPLLQLGPADRGQELAHGVVRFAVGRFAVRFVSLLRRPTALFQPCIGFQPRLRCFHELVVKVFVLECNFQDFGLPKFVAKRMHSQLVASATQLALCCTI